MTIFLAPQFGLSRAMDRVATALIATMPAGHRLVRRPEDADLEVLHVIGYPETLNRAVKAKKRGANYALIQYCLRSTQQPHTDAWLELWAEAETVWSYYDLEQALEDDRGPRDVEFDFYEAPLGVDPIFSATLTSSRPRAYLLGTTGFVADSECLQECADAVKQLGGRMLHIGHDLNLADHVETFLDVSDARLAELYRQCRFVAGLRRTEGFELPIYEGLACGARPIVFDRPHYTDWIGDHAVRIPEGPPEVVTAALTIALREDRPVSMAEQQWVADTFDWRTIGQGFWARCLE